MRSMGDAKIAINGGVNKVVAHQKL